MTPEDLRRALTAVGRRRAAAEARRTTAMVELARLVIDGQGVLSVAEIARLAGVTRQTVYDLRR